MPAYRPGTRVGCIASADETAVKFFGWGVLDGYKPHVPSLADFKKKAVIVNPPPDGHAPSDEDWEQIYKRAKKQIKKTSRCPHITLDGGGEIWGCQCWWAPESAVRVLIADRPTECVRPPTQTASGGESGAES